MDKIYMKKILFTGASGFLGTNILTSLKENYYVDTLGISEDVDYNLSLADKSPKLHAEYNIILHAAGKAHSIPNSEKDIQDFFSINYTGTINLCKGLDNSGLPSSFIFVSTVAVYGCETGELISENHSLNATTPYGKSKIQAEEYLLEWCDRKNVNLIILRPSLLAGHNPPGNLGAMIKGISKGMYLSIAKSKAKKSIAMANDISRLIPCCEGKSGIFNLCDSYNPSFKELEELISKQLGKTMPVSIPLWVAKCLAKAGDIISLIPFSSQILDKITKSLTFSNEKIKRVLNFIPADVLTNFHI
jgi:nucleoside-diphosphate-sugar epimerase